MVFSVKPQSYNEYAAGSKVYGMGSDAPTMGRVDPLGYRQRDLQAKARRNAVLRRLKAANNKDYMSADWLGGPRA